MDRVSAGVLIGGLDDLIYAAWVEQLAVDALGSSDALLYRPLALGVVVGLVIDGLVVAGELVESEFRPWECSSESAVRWITEGWLSSGPERLTPGEVVWLKLTERGVREAERLLAGHRDDG